MLDAWSLLKAKRYNGAVYLAGYAIECHLKYCYCARKGEVYLPASCETHSWDYLVEAAGLSTDLRTAPKILAVYSALDDQWGSSLRYRMKPYPQKDALRLYSEFHELYLFLQELIP